MRNKTFKKSKYAPKIAAKKCKEGAITTCLHLHCLDGRGLNN